MTAVLVAVMAFSMLQLYLVGTLGPALMADIGFSRARLGWLTSTAFIVAAVFSPVAGRLADRLGARRCMSWLLLVVAAALGLIALSPSYGVLVAAVALGGVPQALANPATNRAISTGVDPVRRGAVTGLKQAGVLVGAFVAGLPLTWLTLLWSWRGAVGVMAVLALVTAGGVRRCVPAEPDLPQAAGPRAGPREAVVRGGSSRAARWLAAFSVALGAGNGSVNTYLPLFATERLGMSPGTAGALVAVLAVAGIMGRIGWTRLAQRSALGERLPWLLTGAAALAATLFTLSGSAGVWMVWPAVAGVGGCAVAANAVSILVVINHARSDSAARDTALVTAGFFTGFVIGPPLFAAASQAGGYGVAWLGVAAAFAAAALLARGWQACEHVGSGRRTDPGIPCGSLAGKGGAQDCGRAPGTQALPE
uniref:General substrate transporter n=1 Tax=Streptomyces sp. F12 TaxID=1436084 RepID=V9Z6T7_9ACTN|nr:MFS transporter [Streptomyces sp. F12]AHE40247.1 General substrate transporter [Streptomyces sp. F12]